MEIKRISFIEPSAPGLHIFSKFPIPRLGAVLLATILIRMICTIISTRNLSIPISAIKSKLEIPVILGIE